MIITDQEKQILQKHYAAKIKTWAASLNYLITNDNQDGLANSLSCMGDAASRVVEIQSEWQSDNQAGLEKQKSPRRI